MIRSMIRNGTKIGRTDALMLMTVLLWAVNLSVIKIGLRGLSPHAFNGIRLTIASVAYLLAMAVRREKFRLAPGDNWKAVVLGILGITAYQIFFIQAIDRTNASTASILMATSPVFIAVLSTVLGQERLHWAAWGGIAVSFGGFLFVVSGENGGFSLTGPAVRGAVLILLANVCWAFYTVLSKPVLDRNSPLRLAGIGTAIGTVLYLPITARDLAAVDWRRITWETWGAILYAGLVAIVLCFVIWYASVKKVGSARTGAFSNLTPIFAIAFAALFLGETMAVTEAVGSAVVLLGVYLTRSGYRFFDLKLRRGIPRMD
jgi:drug/metabolite transporter (DMT)-like permease